jgi:hypothetical protein
MNKFLKLGISISLSAAAGFAYFYFVGCKSGSCPITSNGYISTLYGALFGLIFGFPKIGKKKSEDNKNENPQNRQVNNNRGTSLSQASFCRLPDRELH